MKTPLSNGALEGIRIIDLSRVLAGPYCTQILADHGASVLKIEPPAGDETRGWGPPFDADGTASYFLGLNRNKAGRTMDLTLPEQRAELLNLLADADVLVENFKTGTLRNGGWGGTSCPSGSRASCIAASAASAPTGRWAACRATTRRSRRWRES
jgi:crotonobetainyl-CoA:carnitine CoA-transferase CaiB-like acyl-CoA transferase